MDTDVQRRRKPLLAFVLVALATVLLVAPPAHAQVPPPGGVAGHVRYINPDDGSGVPVAGSLVQLCAQFPTLKPCLIAHADANGFFLMRELEPGDYRLRAFPAGSLNVSPATLVVRVQAGAILDGQDLVFRAPAPPPPGMTVLDAKLTDEGIPVVPSAAPVQVRVEGCAGGTGTATISGGATVPLTQGPAGMFSGTLTPVAGTLSAQVTIRLTCPDGPGRTGTFTVFIDPSGHVQTVGGAPIAGATVTLYRADTAAGPFTVVADGDGSVMDAVRNARNPSTTTAAGAFGWDVVPGFYQVRAQKPGCVDPADPSKAYVDSRVMEIGDPVTDLDLRLDCGEESDSAAGNVTGTVGPTLSLTLGGPAHFGTFTPGVAKTYAASTTADVTSSGGDAVLTVQDASATATGRLINGAFALASPLRVGSGGVTSPLLAPVRIAGWSGPVSHDQVTVEFRQSIGATDALRTGGYGKTLTYTLSTTAP